MSGGMWEGAMVGFQMSTFETSRIRHGLGTSGKSNSGNSGWLRGCLAMLSCVWSACLMSMDGLSCSPTTNSKSIRIQTIVGPLIVVEILGCKCDTTNNPATASVLLVESAVLHKILIQIRPQWPQDSIAFDKTTEEVVITLTQSLAQRPKSRVWRVKRGATDYGALTHELSKFTRVWCHIDISNQGKPHLHLRVPFLWSSSGAPLSS